MAATSRARSRRRRAQSAHRLPKRRTSSSAGSPLLDDATSPLRPSPQPHKALAVHCGSPLVRARAAERRAHALDAAFAPLVAVTLVRTGSRRCTHFRSVPNLHMLQVSLAPCDRRWRRGSGRDVWRADCSRSRTCCSSSTSCHASPGESPSTICVVTAADCAPSQQRTVRDGTAHVQARAKLVATAQPTAITQSGPRDCPEAGRLEGDRRTTAELHARLCRDDFLVNGNNSSRPEHTKRTQASQWRSPVTRPHGPGPGPGTMYAVSCHVSCV